MSGMFGGKKATSQKSKAVSALQVQTSTFGQVLPLVYGKNRIAGNLGWYGNWVPTAHTDKQSSGGKGGGGGGASSTSYTYTTGVLILLCAGPIVGIGTVWKDKELHTLSDLGFTLFTGTTPQATWSWLQSYNSAQAIPYSGMAYVAASALQLGSSTGLPNLNYEVKGLKPYQAGTVDDALPSDILTDYLTDSVHGAGFGGYLGSTTQLANYCLARGLFMSPIEDQQRTAADFVNDMATWCNFAPVWSYNQLQLLPYGDTPITGTYGSYTPNVTPIYALGADDFKYEQGSQSGVELDWKELEQCHNSVRVEYNDRANSYNTVPQDAKDQADIDARGHYPLSSVQINGITSAQVARDIAQLMLQRDLYIRKTYHFRTDMRYMLLEPMDSVTLTDPNAGLTNELVRITKVTEQNDELEFEAEELPIGVASAPQYAPQNSGGYSQDFNVSPGSVSAPVIFNAPGLLTKDGFEMWVAIAGIGQFWGGCDVYVSEDNTTYQRVGRITAPARYGALTAALPAGNDPDTTNSAHVSLLRGQLSSGSQADADNWRQMAFVGGASGGEVIAFETATLTGTLSYSLSYLRRGGYGSTNQAHVSGDVFARIDEAIFRMPYDKGKRGNTVYFKFTSFNVFGGAMEQLSAVTSYSHVVGASDVLAPLSLFDQLAGQYASPASGSNFIPNPSFELNNISAPASVTIANMPVCDSWYVYPGNSAAFTAGVDATNPEVGSRDLTISAVNGFSVPANGSAAFRVVSAPIYVAPGQLLSFSGDLRSDSAGGNPSSITWAQVVGMLFFNSSGAVVAGGDINVGVTAAANAATGSYQTMSSAQVTVPSGTSYAVAYVYLSASNSSASAATLNSWASRFDKLVGTFVTNAGQVNYTTGQTVDSLKPAQAGADVTATQTLVGIVNPQFESGMTGWTPESDASNWYAETGTNGPLSGTTNYMVHHDSATTTYLRNAYKCPVSPSQVIKGQLICRGVGSPTGTATVRLLWQDSTGADISSSNGTTLVGNGTKTLTVTGAAPSNAAFCQINPGVGFASGTLGYYTFDNVQWNAQPSSVDEVPDGSTYARTNANALQSGVPVVVPGGKNFLFNGSFASNNVGTALGTSLAQGAAVCDGWTVASRDAAWLVEYEHNAGSNADILMRLQGGTVLTAGASANAYVQTVAKYPVVAGQPYICTVSRGSANNVALPSGVTVTARFYVGFQYADGTAAGTSAVVDQTGTSNATANGTVSGTVPTNAVTAVVTMQAIVTNTNGTSTTIGSSGQLPADLRFYNASLVLANNLDTEVVNGTTYAKTLGNSLQNGVPQQFAGGKNVIANGSFANNLTGTPSGSALAFGAAVTDGWAVSSLESTHTIIYEAGTSGSDVLLRLVAGSTVAAGATATSAVSTYKNFSAQSSAPFSFSVVVNAANNTSLNSGITVQFVAFINWYDGAGNVVGQSVLSQNGNSYSTETLNATGTTPSNAVSGSMAFQAKVTNSNGTATAVSGATGAPADIRVLEAALVMSTQLATEVSGTLATQKNLPAVTFSNYGSGWNGLSFSYSATTTSATISATAATLQAGSDAISYNAASTTVSGSAGTSVTYYLYYNDPNHAGGSQTLVATTSQITALSNNGNVLLGTASVTYPTSGTGTGSGGGLCPLRKAWVVRRGVAGRRQYVRAGQVRKGDFLLLCNGAWGEVTYSKPAQSECVRLVSKAGTLGCSTSAPIKTRHGHIVAKECEGKEAAVLVDVQRHARVDRVLPLGEQWVQHITCQNDFFWTGDSKDCLFAHHNMKPS